MRGQYRSVGVACCDFTLGPAILDWGPDLRSIGSGPDRLDRRTVPSLSCRELAQTMQALSVRSRVSDPEDAWWIAFAERDQIDIVTEHAHLHQARTSQMVWKTRDFVVDV
jgi:hypothetical protein